MQCSTRSIWALRGVSVSDGRPAKPTGEGKGLAILKAKYHDYCSSQVADLLLFLTPDEIYVVAEKAARERSDVSGDDSFAHMVQGATNWLAERAGLPSFDTWLEDYRRDPESYEEHFMGLWESEVD